jgi:glycosyltransferase involved in cell wall biosynthesis
MRVVQVSASDGGGGAHKVANSLYAGLRARGHQSAMAVGQKKIPDTHVVVIPRGISRSRLFSYRVAGRIVRLPAKFIAPLRPLRRALRAPLPLAYLRQRATGREIFDYPGSRLILSLTRFTPELVHLHNLHNEFFDLRFLPELSTRAPVVMTLHDEWTYTGHCAYTLIGDRWRDGCRSCPDLQVYPAIDRDATHENWLAKKEIYEHSRLYVTSPSRWLLDRARESILAGGAVDFRLIRNGVDLSVFKPASQMAARAMLRLPREPLVLLFAANALNKNPFKDYGTIEAAVERLAAEPRDRPLLLIALGGTGPTRRFPNAEMRQVPYETVPERVAAYYQAADVYLHAANADTFPTTILEAMATGISVVATAVGGIPEQVHSLDGVAGAWAGESTDLSTATGVLVAPHDSAGMAAATSTLLADRTLRERLGANATAEAAANYDIERQIDETIKWYGEIIADWSAWRQANSVRARSSGVREPGP